MYKTETATTGNITYTGGEITVNSITQTAHTHSQGSDGDGDSEAETNSPTSGT